MIPASVIETPNVAVASYTGSMTFVKTNYQDHHYKLNFSVPTFDIHKI